MVTVDTKLVGLLGDPLKQTFSPQMHNETFQKLDLDYFYFPIEVGNEKLLSVVTGIKNMHFAGFNVTKPNKIKIMEYLDEVDELAEKIGSVNTVVIKDGKLKGYNTDGEGFVKAYMDKTTADLSQTTFFVFGAGGAARAVCSTLAFKGAKKIYITDKISEASKSLVNDINTNIASCAEVVPFGQNACPQYIAKSNVLINASGVGMYPHLGESPISKEVLRKDLFVIDCTYNPDKTQLLLDAEECGCKIMNGLGMCINQGAKAFSLWTGVEEPTAMMSETIAKIVSGNK